MSTKATKNRKAYKSHYLTTNYKMVSFRLSFDKDSDLIAWIEQQPCKKGYITDLIKKDMLNKK
jgi:hypothetical protein